MNTDGWSVFLIWYQKKDSGKNGHFLSVLKKNQHSGRIDDWSSLQNSMETTSQVEWHSKEVKSVSLCLQRRGWLTKTTLRSPMGADLFYCQVTVLVWLLWGRVSRQMRSSRLSKSGIFLRCLEDKATGTVCVLSTSTPVMGRERTMSWSLPLNPSATTKFEKRDAGTVRRIRRTKKLNFTCFTGYVSFWSWSSVSVQGLCLVERHLAQDRKELDDGSKISVLLWHYYYFGAWNRNNNIENDQLGHSPVLEIHAAAIKTNCAHLIPPQEVDLLSCEMIKMIIKDLEDV